MDDTICFCKYARPALIAWGYIKLILLLLSTVPLYLALILIMFYGNNLEIIVCLAILITYPIALGFDIALIIAAHMRKVKTLKACFYYLITEMIFTLVLVPWITNIIEYDGFIDMSLYLKIGLMTVLILVQGVISILMVHSELKKLSDENGVAHEDVGYKNLKDGKEIRFS